jgi:pyrimidine operon attenuation protein / uracil phosphoribosyltransferase
MKERELMDAKRLERTLSRMAQEVTEHEADVSRLVLVGVRRRGVPLARRLARLIGEAARVEPPVGALDITLYRDDLTAVAAQPVIHGTDIPCSIDGRRVVLVDDVLFTGRTVRAALDELIDFGRPARIELAVLVDRGHRELPIRADYVGEQVSTAREQIVQVELREQDGRDRVMLVNREQPSVPLPPAAPPPAAPPPAAARSASPRKAAPPRKRGPARTKAGRKR